MLAQRQTRANNHLQTHMERPVSLLSPEHQTLKICRQEQLRFLSKGVPWQNNPEVKHRGLQTLSIQKMVKLSMRGFTFRFIAHSLKATWASVCRGIHKHAWDVEVSFYSAVSRILMKNDMWCSCIMQWTISFELCSYAYEQHLHVEDLLWLFPLRPIISLMNICHWITPSQFIPQFSIFLYIQCITKSFD